MSIFPTKILLATDGSKDAEAAVRAAGGLAERTGSELHAVTVWRADRVYWHPEHGSHFEEALRKLRREAQEVLDEQVRRIEGSGMAVAKAHLRMGGRRDREIVDLAEKIGARLIVLGSRGLGGMRRALMGSVSDSVVRHAHCPVLVVHAQEDGEAGFPPKKILLATDGSEEARLAARTAADLAGTLGSELHVVTVGRGRPGEQTHSEAEIQALRWEAGDVLDREVARLWDAGGEVAQVHLRMAEKRDEAIVGLAEELGVGLIAMGSRGLGGVRRALMGSVSDSVVRHAHCPVLVVRPEKSVRGPRFLRRLLAAGSS